MDFLKKHYEKILLGVMLAGLIGMLVFMLFYIASDTDEMNKRQQSYFNPPVRALTNLDMTAYDGVMERTREPYALDLENTNKLLNPQEWQRDADNNLVLVSKHIGPQVVVVTNITPLYTIVSLDNVITNELGVRYVIKVERQAAATPAKRRPVPHYVPSTDRSANSDFALVDIKGTPEAPTSLTVKLVDTGETVSIASGKPYRRVDGYLADFRYDPERRAFHGQRVGSHVSFGGSDYSVVDVSEHEVILQDQSNQKKTSLRIVP